MARFDRLRPVPSLGLALGAALLASCGSKDCPPAPAPAPGTGAATSQVAGTGAAKPAGAPTVAEAQAFMDDVEKRLLAQWISQYRIDWINNTHITDDTDALAAEASEKSMEVLTTAIKDSVRFKELQGMSPELARKFHLLRAAATLPSPGDDKARKELAELAVKLNSTYGKGKYCSDKLKAWAPEGAKAGEACLAVGDLTNVLKDPKASWDQLVEAFEGWRTISIPMRADYARFVELGNQGAKELGFADVGAVWKSRYDMATDALEADIERMWQQVKPLYDQLHCYVRGKMQDAWGKDKVPDGQPIPAHLFGNMWSQQWAEIYPKVEPFPGQPSLDVTAGMKKKGLDPVAMTKIAEGFFVSLGMPPLPESFWTKSQITKPRDRDVVCHASAWSLDYKDDLRIKMCTEVNEDDLVTLHHELGHNYYQRAYNQQPLLFQDGANDGFHEAIGDTIALSITPEYLVKQGILASATRNDKADINILMQRALDKVAFLPFGLMIDKWRWDVFAGKITPEQYNEAWWALVRQYQGLTPPSPRDEQFFDPGAKFHVPGNTPYLRYFLAHIYQFQFHRALCKAAGHTGPLHTCSIYGSKEAGAKFEAMLKMGISKPWPEAMAAVTGETAGDASALLEYFAPLQKWLEEQNQGKQCGW